MQPSLQQHNMASFSILPVEHKQVLFTQMCGVVSERTGRMCTRYCYTRNVHVTLHNYNIMFAGQSIVHSTLKSKDKKSGYIF